jgi:hypothetical protein
MILLLIYVVVDIFPIQYHQSHENNECWSLLAGDEKTNNLTRVEHHFQTKDLTEYLLLLEEAKREITEN